MSSFIRLCSTGLFLYMLLTKPAAAGFDYLEIPALQTQRAANSLLLDVVVAGKRLIAVGERGHIVFSDNGGDSWSQASVPVYVTLTAVYFPTAKRGWAVGHDGIILYSDDRGEHWVKQLDGYAINEQVLLQAEQRVKLAEQRLISLAGTEKELAEQTLDEAAFTLDTARQDSEIGPAKPLLDVWFKNEREGFVIGAYGIFLHTRNAGKSWDLWSPRLNNPDEFHLNTISASSAGVLFIAGESGALFRSRDGGNTWGRLESPYLGSYFGMLMVPNKSKADALLVFGLKGNLYRSNDLGSSWQQIDSQTQSNLFGGTLLANDSVSIVGSGATVLHSNDAGRSFKRSVGSDRLLYTQVAHIGNGRMVVTSVRGIRHLGADGSIR